MRYRNFSIFLTLIIISLCCYYLSFTYISLKIEKEATQQATDVQGYVNFAKKQEYLESLSKKPIYKLFKYTYNYEEIKENALVMGLDLQGGMHLTLEVSPSEVIKGLCKNNHHQKLDKILREAEILQQTNPHLKFTKLFYKVYQQSYPNQPLREIFATLANSAKISYKANNEEILNFIDTELSLCTDRALKILRNRLDKFGTSQPTIQKLPATGKIQVELPGVTNPERVRKLLKGVAKLTFWEVYTLQELENSLEKINQILLHEEHKKFQESNQKNKEVSKTEEKNKLSKLFNLIKLQYSDYTLTYLVDDVNTITKIFEREDVKAMLGNRIKCLWDVKSFKDKKGKSYKNLYFIKEGFQHQPLLEGDVIVNARQTIQDDKGRAAVSMQMNTKGSKAWHKITAKNLQKPIAIVLDNKVYSAPVVQGEISNGNTEISGNFTVEEAQDLANVLQTGSLPASVNILEEAIIGPTLSNFAQKQGFTSMLIGLLIVIFFMVAYYAKAGLIANVALLFNIIFLLGILAQLNTSLTLSGIAGIVLTMGMSIDANVLIFERIKEEIKQGLPVLKAIEMGYQKAYSSIIDSNITTFLTGAILYVIGQGPIKGFATTLMIGIGTSLFTAITITRIIINFTVRGYSSTKYLFSFPWTKNLFTNFHIPFIAKKRIAYVFSFLFISIGFFLMWKQKSLNLGVDFTGGRSYIIHFSKPVEPVTLKTNLSEYLGKQSMEVKTYGTNNILKLTTSYLIHDTSEKADQKVTNLLIKGIQSKTSFQHKSDSMSSKTHTFHIVSSSKVAATIVEDIKKSSQKSIIVSLIMIFIYILIRFQRWQFGLAAVLALMHDTLAVFSAFSIARYFGYYYEIDQVFIASILTIIGYSINDTVVIFDRIRENISKKSRLESFLSIANKSINETLSRTLMTSFTTLLVVCTLFLFGGETLKSFSFALLIGILFGTYSSICIAVPLVTSLSKQALEEID